MKIAPFAALCLTGAFLLPAGGCIHGESKTSLSGDYVGMDTYKRIQVGETTDSWVLAALGEPTRRSPIEGGELWAWEYERISESEGGVFLFIGGSDYEESAGGTYIEIKDGVVSDAWRD